MRYYKCDRCKKIVEENEVLYLSIYKSSGPDEVICDVCRDCANEVETMLGFRLDVGKYEISNSSKKSL